MRTNLLYACVNVLLGASISQALTNEEMRANWQEMNASKGKTIQQFNHDKFGMFIH